MYYFTIDSIINLPVRASTFDNNNKGRQKAKRAIAWARNVLLVTTNCRLSTPIQNLIYGSFFDNNAQQIWLDFVYANELP